MGKHGHYDKSWTSKQQQLESIQNLTRPIHHLTGVSQAQSNAQSNDRGGRDPRRARLIYQAYHGFLPWVRIPTLPYLPRRLTIFLTFFHTFSTHLLLKPFFSCLLLSYLALFFLTHWLHYPIDSSFNSYL
jgi:hypothetical protein